MSTYIIIAFAVICAICLLIGLFKGYTKLSYWGGAVAGTVFITSLCSRLVPSDNGYYGLFVLGIAVGVLLVLSFLFSRVKRYIYRATEAGRKLSFYRNRDNREQNEEQILLALDNNDKKSYKKFSKRKFRDSSGPWGIVDKVFGGLTLAVNAAVVLSVIISIVLLTIDFAQIPEVTEAFKGALESSFWIDFLSKFAFDVITVTLAYACLTKGYKSGLISSLGTLFIIGLVCGAGFVAYHLAFNVTPFVKLAEDLTQGAFAGMVSDLSGVLETLQLQPVVIAQVAITVGQFILYLIPVVIIGIFTPRVIEKIRGAKVANVIDGVFGSLITFGIVFAVLMFVGALVYQINDFEVLSRFNEYMNNAVVANCLYGNNFIAELEFIKNIPLRSWFGQ